MGWWDSSCCSHPGVLGSIPNRWAQFQRTCVLRHQQVTRFGRSTLSRPIGRNIYTQLHSTDRRRNRHRRRRRPPGATPRPGTACSAKAGLSALAQRRRPARLNGGGNAWNDRAGGPPLWTLSLIKSLSLSLSLWRIRHAQRKTRDLPTYRANTEATGTTETSCTLTV